VAVPVAGGVYANGYRCSEVPVYNVYDGLPLHYVPAVYLGYAYRPYYRYTAYRVSPITLACQGFWRPYRSGRRW
jgi:hypothetical protein